MNDLEAQCKNLNERLQMLEQALQESESRFRSFFEKNSAVMLLLEPDSGEIVDANDAASLYYGYPLQCLVGMSIADINVLDPEQIAAERDSALHEKCGRFRFQHRRADGVIRCVEVYTTPVTTEGRLLLLSVVQDVTRRVDNEEALRCEQRRLNNLLRASKVCTWEWNYQTNQILPHECWTSMFGDRSEELGPMSLADWTERVHPEDRQEARRSLTDYIEGHCDSWQCEIRMRHSDGHWVWVQVRAEITERSDDNRPLWIVGTLLDIGQRKLYEQRLARMAHYDALTGLPNRLLLSDRLGVAMRQVHRRRQMIVLVYLDLDGFREVNNRYGHDVGDRLLIKVATRLQRSLRSGDTLSRLGGDEFVAVLLDLPDREGMQPLLARMLEVMASPFWIEGTRLTISASLGVSIYPQDDLLEPDQLLRQAGHAMYQAKLAGKNRYHLFDNEQARSVRGFHEQLERLGQALSHREFVLYYQPKVNMRTGELIGAEALIRWQHPEKGLLPPSAFLPLLKEQALGIELGEWVMESVLEQLRRWQQCGFTMPVSVNLAANQLLHPDFIPCLQRLLARFSDLSPSLLEVEILESSAVHDFEQARAVVKSCGSLGVRVALDDFGIGYSSLSYLRRLPVNVLKIDRSFVHDMLYDSDDLAILEGILGMANAFRLQVVAEGVESRAHGELLLQLGCQIGQGFHIARPMPAEALPDWAANWRPDPEWTRQSRLSLDKRPLLWAIVGCRGWFKAVVEYCQGHSDQAPCVDPLGCDFGRWMRNEGRHCLTAPLVEQLNALHEQIHDCADRLIERHEAGEMEVDNAGVEALDTLCKELIAALQARLVEA